MSDLHERAKNFASKYKENFISNSLQADNNAYVAGIEVGYIWGQKEYEDKLRWIPVEEKEPPVGVELQCKIERLSWTDNKYAVGIFNENRVWSIDGRHVSHYKDAVNNCVTHYRSFL